MAHGTITGLLLDPLDTLFFRDGRPFQAASRVESGLPFPQTMAGALRTGLLASTDRFSFSKFAARRRDASDSAALEEILIACGAEREHIQARFRGPWLALSKNGEVQPLLPVPATLVADPADDGSRPSNWRVLRPWDTTQVPLPGWAPTPASLWPLWRNDIVTDAERPGGFLTLRGITQFLAATNQDAALDGLEAEFFTPGELYATDSRVGIAIDPDKLTAAHGMLYGINLMSLRDQIKPDTRKGMADDPYVGWKVGLYVETIGPTDVRQALHGRPIPLGGEGRHVAVTVVDRQPNWPLADRCERSIIYLATPGIFTQSGRSHWLPNAFAQDGVVLRGAASDKAASISGWDIAKGGPKPTRFVVPAGAVYFVEGQPEYKQGSLCSDAEDVAQGWGFALQGEWK